MAHDRHDRVASLIRELAAAFIGEEANTDPMITVTRVSISRDYTRATIYVTTIPDGSEAQALSFLKRKAGEFRSFIKKKKSSLKTIPHIEFELDAGERHRQHIDKISSELKAGQNSIENDEGGEAGHSSSDEA